MKKVMLVLLLVAAVPAMAAVTFTATDIGGGQLQISYTTTLGDLPRGIALRVDITDTAGTATIATDATVAVDPAFNAFVDYAYSNPMGYAVGNGHPLADPAGAGELAADANSVSVSMGVLDQLGAQAAGPADANLIVLQLAGSGTVNVVVSADTLRGPDSGVVGSVLTSNLPLAGVDVVLEVPDCYAGQPDWDEYVAVGKPASWCNKYQCRGDADGANEVIATLPYPPYTVYAPVGPLGDLPPFIAAYRKQIGDPAQDLATDFDHLQEVIATLPYPPYTVYARTGPADLVIFIEYYRDELSTVPGCGTPALP